MPALPLNPPARMVGLTPNSWTRFGGFFYFWSRDLPADEYQGGESMKPEVPTSWGEERRGWHIDKTINAGNLISIISCVIPVLIWAATVETRFTASTEKAQNLERQVIAEKLSRDQQRSEDRQTNQAALIDLQQQIRMMGKDMGDKLDRISDKVGARR